MAAASKKPLQNDLRRLMKERRSQSTKRIKSDLAKYDNQGQLSCQLCSSPVKNETLWATHIASKIHKNNLLSLKQKSNLQTSVKENENESANKISKLGKVNDVQNTEKRIPQIPVDQKSPKNEKLNSSSSKKTINRSEEVRLSQNDEPLNNETSDLSKLPPDFFETSSATSLNNEETPVTNDIVTTISDKQEGGNTKGTEPLPEGFFDDPKLDAKARHVDYKDPMDEEWEKFQKTINEETNVSQAIIEGDMEESKVERDIDEVEEQIHNWARVEALQKRHEKLAQQDGTQDSNNFEEMGVEENDYEDLLDWRSKGVWN